MDTQTGRIQRARRLIVWTSAALIALVGSSTAFADTCSPVPGDESEFACYGLIYPPECPAQSGGLQQIYNTGGGTAWPQSAIANISSFNPSPVYTNSNVWAALEQNSQNKGLIAQVGWVHDTSSYNEYAFAQITDNNGTFSPIHSFYATPSGTNNYAAYRQSNGTFDLEWSGGTWLPGNSYSWGSDAVAFVGEVIGFDPNERDGDHFAGNRTTPVVFSNANWSDQYGTNHTANLSWFAGNIQTSVNGSIYIPPYGFLYHWSSSHFEIWDSRCS